MPFGISKDEDNFWNQKELAYQHVHMFYAFWLGFAVYSIFPVWYVPLLCGMFAGTLMETYQHIDYIRSWTKPKKMVDMFRDWLFWTIGGCLNYIIIFVGV